MLAFGLLLAVDGVWAAAIPVLLIGTVAIWLVGAWVLPWTRDAYVRRVWRVWRAWAADTQVAYGRFENRQATFASRIAALSPPPELRSEHERLVSLTEEQARLRRQPGPLAGAREVTTAQKAAREVQERLSRYAASEEQQTYVAALDRLFVERRGDYATAAAGSERATAEAVQKLARAKPPDSVATEHQALSAAMRAHLDVVRAFHAASQATAGRQRRP